MQEINLDDHDAATIYDYVKNVMLAPESSDDQIEMAYANIRIWLDSKNVTSDPVAYIDSSREEAYKVATGPAYETVLGEEEAAKVTGEPVGMTQQSKFRVAAIIAVVAFLFWYLFKEDGQGTSVQAS